ncbi:DUF6090 family protein [uncultured Eudoraea sp.]|uniref:DUF6090 family protein n=1 Tax=uncultured Eudoraea sp. TaxID=1035614 RepID=UPI00261382FC|nr:DUF6090 family protein [uncultured Eudoraea sp.]
MINFFRKIRKKMLTENKFSKYLLYAIGEIILVVIGILIALSINNWNENKKTQNQLSLILYNLIEDLNDDLEYLYDEVELHEFRISCFQYLLEKSDIKKFEFNRLPKQSDTWWQGAYPDTINLKYAEKCVMASVYDYNVNIQTSSIDEMKNLGIFSNIKNNALKKAINKYYGFMPQIRQDWNRDLITDWRKFLLENYDIIPSEEILSMVNPIEFVKDNKSVSTRIRALEGPAQYRFYNVNIAINLAEEVIQLIKEEVSASDTE